MFLLESQFSIGRLSHCGCQVGATGMLSPQVGISTSPPVDSQRALLPETSAGFWTGSRVGMKQGSCCASYAWKPLCRFLPKLSVPQFLPPCCGGKGLLPAAPHTHCSQPSPAWASGKVRTTELPPSRGPRRDQAQPWGPQGPLTREAKTQALGSDFWAQ